MPDGEGQPRSVIKLAVRRWRHFGSLSSCIEGAMASSRHGCFYHRFVLVVVSQSNVEEEDDDDENSIDGYFINVKTWMYEPSLFRVLVTWPRAPMYLPVPPRTGRSTGLSASNSGTDGE